MIRNIKMTWQSRPNESETMHELIPANIQYDCTVQWGNCVGGHTCQGKHLIVQLPLKNHVISMMIIAASLASLCWWWFQLKCVTLRLSKLENQTTEALIISIDFILNAFALWGKAPGPSPNVWKAQKSVCLQRLSKHHGWALSTGILHLFRESAMQWLLQVLYRIRR